MTTKHTIAVRGAGIMGLMAAHSLKNALPDANITIFDSKGFPASNASYMAGGMLAPYAEIEHMDMDWVNAGLASIDIWQNTPLDTGFSKQGSLLITHNEDRHILERFKTHLPNDAQTPVNAQEMEPALHERFQSGILIESEAHLDPHKTMQSLCRWLSDNGVNMIKSTEKPESADWIIDCRGMNAEETGIRGVKGETLLVRNPEFELSRPVRLMHPRYPLYIIPRGHGVFMIGATVIESADNENVSLRSSMELMSALYALHPSFGEAEIIELKAGIRPSYPDNLPRIRIDEDNKTISCNGLFRHGYLLAPVMAQCVAEHIQGQQHEFMPLFNKGLNDENHNKRAA